MTITSLIVAGLVTSAMSYLLVRFAPVHIAFALDGVGAGPQHFHVKSTPRIGGVAILLGTVCGAGLLAAQNVVPTTEALLLLFVALPVFLAGLGEDLHRNVRPKHRLWLSFGAAALGFLLLDAELRRLDILIVDSLLAFMPAAFLLTVFAVGGVAHAFNIIDGYNGLAAVVAIAVLGALGYVAGQVGDPLVFGMCLVMVGALIGFLVWNFPLGSIFAGDSGAYFVGFVVAQMSVLLVARNPEVSPWFPMLLCIYPVWETLFSIYRKRILRGQSPHHPDGLHLHMLVYKRVVRYRVRSRDPNDRTVRNALTSPYLWALTMTSVVPAILFWDKTWVLALACLVFAAVYCRLYWRIVKFRTPRWLILRRS
jgi:UDP-N-acetylmuramyl pentapeptide phosphotransferase/UDP-N-acetylglucosamine-1-phosphate transferase